jgi:outer membrane protein assembly factor BamB
MLRSIHSLLSCQVALLVLAMAPALATAAPADRWPMYRANPARTAHVESSLDTNLAARWVYRAEHAPQPAWPRSPRMPFDRAQHVVIADGKVFFGSTVDCQVRALDLESGKQAWSLTTAGPIRFAPAIWKDRLLAVSDDGFLYALSLDQGQLLWKKRGGPDDSTILGNNRLISKWPVRGGPVVIDDVAYFAAGIWPTDGIYLHALNPQDGEPIWVNSESGSRYMAQPHGGANAKSGASAQGYLVVSGNHLLVPTGRAVPAAFDREKGELAFFHLQKFGHNGGTPTMAIGDMFFNSGIGFSSESGDKLSTVGTGQLAATSDGLVRAAGGVVTGYKFVEAEKPDRKGNLVKVQVLEPSWVVKNVHTDASLMVAGQHVISGSAGHVDIIDLAEHKVIQSLPIDGTAYGLAVASGRLLVSTDTGSIHCFAADNGEPLATVGNKPPATPADSDSELRQYAQQVLKRADIRAGFCVDFGCGDGALAEALADQTNLQIIAIDDDPENVQRARQRLIARGLYGSRVIVLLRSLEKSGLPRYMADLVVSQRSWQQPLKQDWITEQVRRIQRPHGGTICVGAADQLVVNVREGLDGAGSWTHQYANAGNTLNSQDDKLKGTLSMLWFRDIAFDIPQRHGRAPAPLYDRGRLLHQGLDGIIAVDAYTGRELWRYEIKNLLRGYDGDQLMGVAGTGGNFCLHGDSVFVRDETRCLKINIKTGELEGEFKPPPGKDGKPSRWGYISCLDGILYGSVADPEHVVTFRYVERGGDMKRLLTESRTLFALNPDNGELLWKYNATNSIRHNSIAVAGGKVCLIDRPQALFDRVKKPENKFQSGGTLVVLDAKTGAPMWKNDEDIYGTTVSVSEKHKALVMSYQPTSFRLDSEIGGRISVFSLENGKRLWDAKADYRSRPMINDKVIYAQGAAWNLLSGETIPFEFSRSYGCGVLAGASSMMLFRSGTLGYFHFDGDNEVANYGGMRPGCWVNAIPAGGIVLVPDASAGCQCSYLNKAWIALQGEE